MVDASDPLFKGPAPTTEEAKALLARWSLYDLVNLVVMQAVRVSKGDAFTYEANAPMAGGGVKVTVRVKKMRKTGTGVRGPGAGRNQKSGVSA